MITIEHDRDGYIVCRAAGTLTRKDYEAAVPELENAMQLRDAPLRLMIVLENFDGMDVGAMWEDLKFDVRHNDDFSRIAIVGDSVFAEWATRLTRPFFGAEIQFFEENERTTARDWLLGIARTSNGSRPENAG